MPNASDVFSVNPIGVPVSGVVEPPESVTLSTPNGPVTVAWEPGTAASMNGLAVFFIEFLHKTGLWSALVGRCPLKRTSPNAPDTATVVGSLLLSVLGGGNRYRHVDNIRGDTVLPELLGMDRILSSDAMRRAVAALAKVPEGQSWIADLLLESVLPIISKAPWIMDLDSTVVTVYGSQSGSAVGYNPTKKGRPSYSYHAMLIGNLRLPLDMDARPGNESHGIYGADELWKMLDTRLPALAQPWCIRGDISYGSEVIMAGCEARHRDYLFKLRHSAKIQALISDCDTGNHQWFDAGQGWEGREQTITLMNWTSARRVIVIRRPRDATKKPLAIAHQQSLFVAELCPDDFHEYAVLVTSLTQPIAVIAQFYRDRADSENVFADLKNDWAWGGFTTQDQSRNHLMARFVALIYTWWNIFVRQASPIIPREGHVSRPVLLHAVARRITHAGKTILRITSLHANAHTIATALNSISQQLNSMLAAAAQQLTNKTQSHRWHAYISHIFDPYLTARAGPTA